MNILDKASFPDNEAYHASGNLGTSKFNDFLRSPMIYKHLHIDSEGRATTDAMKRGSLIHCMVLTPELMEDEYRERSEYSLRSKDDKAVFVRHLIDIDAADEGDFDDLMALKADDLRALEEAGKFTYLPMSEMNLARKVSTVAKSIMPKVNGNTEAAFTAEICGVMCQCKADLIDTDNNVWDLKTTANIEKWVRDFENCHLVIPDTFYRMVIEAVTGVLVPPIRYCAVSVTEPHDAVIRHYPERLYDMAKLVIHGHLKRFKVCQESGVWPGIDGEVKPTPKEAAVNTWAEQRLEDQAKLDEQAFDAFIESRADDWPWEEKSKNENGETE